VTAVRTEPLFLIVAAVLHAVVPIAARVIIRPNTTGEEGPRVALRPIQMEEIPIERLPDPAPVPAAVPVPDPAVTAAPPPDPRPVPAAAPGPVPSNPSPGGPVEPGPAPTAAPTAPPSRAGGPDHYDALPDDGKGGVLTVPGVGGPAIWAIPGGLPAAPTATAAPTVAPAPRPVDSDIAGSVIREAMRDHDKKLGIDPVGGAVATAVKQAVASSDSPAVSRASFEVRLGPDGRVISVRVSSFNSGTADVWARVAQAAQAILKGKTLTMSAELAKGGTVYVSMSSVVQLPSGSSSAIRQQGAGASFDLSDIGAKKSRVVSTSFSTTPAR
jgi:hypothetical protein